MKFTTVIRPSVIEARTKLEILSKIERKTSSLSRKFSTYGDNVIVRESVTINRGTSAKGSTNIGNNVLFIITF